MPKILTVVGARPQFIKAAVVSRAFRHLGTTRAGSIDELIVHTGQHYDDAMSSVFFREMGIPEPAFNLGVGGGGHGAMTGRMLAALETTILEVRPDAVLVYGDTNSTLAGALAAAKLHVPLAHVEAGLRSFNRRMPEEINRIVADQLADWLYCPTDTAVRNLAAEGITGGRVERSGDVMCDAALHYARVSQPSERIALLAGPARGRFHLATVHRAENTDDAARLRDIFGTLSDLAQTEMVIVPVHPRTAKALAQAHVDTGGVTLIEPVGYFDMLHLLQGCKAVLTDSGGLQKEAYFFGKPCLTLRDETEWTELVEAGCNILVGTDPERIRDGLARIESGSFAFPPALYGDGNSGIAIARHLLDRLQ